MFDDELILFLKRAEGFSPRAYRDGTGWSIGYGHRFGSGGKLRPEDRHLMTAELSEQEAEELLREDRSVAALGVKTLLTVEIPQPSFDALVSFAFNVGLGNFSRSTLRRLLNKREWRSAAAQFGRWVHSRGQVIPGLISRRAQEAAMFLDGFTSGNRES